MAKVKWDMLRKFCSSRTLIDSTSTKDWWGYCSKNLYLSTILHYQQVHLSPGSIRTTQNIRTYKKRTGLKLWVSLIKLYSRKTTRL